MKLLRKTAARSGQEYSLSVLLGVVTLVSILPFLLLGIYGLSRYVSEERANQLTRMTRYTEALTSAVDRELKGYIDTAEVLASSRNLARGYLDLFDALARDAATKANGRFVLIDRSGQLIVDTSSPAGTNLSAVEDADKASLNEAIRSGNPIVSSLFSVPSSNKLTFVIRVPIKIDGEIRYVLSFEPNYNLTYNILQQSYLPDGWRAAVIDGNGRIVARSFRHNEFYGKLVGPQLLGHLDEPRGIAELTELENRNVVTAHQRSGLSDWHVAIWAPKSLLNAPTDQVIALVIGLAALTFLVSFAAAYLAGRIIAEPARQLLKGARALGAGEPVRFKTTHMREANVVGLALAEAAQNIAARQQALRKSELHTRFIMRELAHRSKNLLAVVQAIARQTGRTARDVKEFNEQLGERLAGLGRSQDLLVQKNWQGVSLEDLAAAQLKPFFDRNEQRFVTNGPPVLLSSDAAQNIGMALHELATNASKHGALSTASGRVGISWNWCKGEDGERRLQLRWKETDGPRVKPPSRKGFGHAVIEHLTAASLHGNAELDWRPEGLVWTLEVPESAFGEHSDEPDEELADAAVTTLLRSRQGATDSVGQS